MFSVLGTTEEFLPEEPADGHLQYAPGTRLTKTFAPKINLVVPHALGDLIEYGVIILLFLVAFAVAISLLMCCTKIGYKIAARKYDELRAWLSQRGLFRVPVGRLAPQNRSLTMGGRQLSRIDSSGRLESSGRSGKGSSGRGSTVGGFGGVTLSSHSAAVLEKKRARQSKAAPGSRKSDSPRDRLTTDGDVSNV